MGFAWCVLAGGFLSVHVGRVIYSIARLEASAFFGLLSFVLSVGTMWYWLWRYALRHRLSLPLDIGMFLAAAPFLVVPGYVVAAQRWRSIVTLGGLLLAYGGTYLAAVLLSYVLTG